MVASCDLQSHKACLFEATLIVALCKKAVGGEIKFFRAAGWWGVGGGSGGETAGEEL